MHISKTFRNLAIMDQYVSKRRKQLPLTLAVAWPQDVGLANDEFKVAAQVNRDVRHPQGATNSEGFRS